MDPNRLLRSLARLPKPPAPDWAAVARRVAIAEGTGYSLVAVYADGHARAERTGLRRIPRGVPVVARETLGPIEYLGARVSLYRGPLPIAGASAVGYGRRMLAVPRRASDQTARGARVTAETVSVMHAATGRDATVTRGPRVPRVEMTRYGVSVTPEMQYRTGQRGRNGTAGSGVYPTTT